MGTTNTGFFKYNDYFVNIVNTDLSQTITGQKTFTQNIIGDLTGNADTATKLANVRTIRTNLASTSTASFDGSANITPGVTGILPVANGGTGSSTASGALSNLGISNLESTYVKVSGSRGNLAGYETVSTSSSSSLTISYTSSDTTIWTTTGSRTLRFSSAGSSYCGVKVVACYASGSTTLTVSGATWANNGDAPDWGSSGTLLVLVAHFIRGSVILSVFHNSD